MSVRDPAEAGRGIADALRAARIPHALGGALALGVAGVPRGTKDVDVNVFSPPSELPRAIAALQALGIRRWMTEMMGGDDERVTRWNDIVARLGTSRP